MRRNHSAEVSALTTVVRTAVGELESAGRSLSPATREALLCVERWIAGEPATRDDLGSACVAAHDAPAAGSQGEKDQALSWANVAIGNLAWLASKARGWQNGERGVMDAAEYTISSLRTGEKGIRERLEATRVSALERALSSGALPLAPKVTTASPGGKPRRLKGELAPFIGAVASARLSTLKAIIDPAQRGDDAVLRALLVKRRHPAHEALLSFERRYGGLIMPDAPGGEGTDWMFGAFACLSSGSHAAAIAEDSRTLVPVVYSPNDIIYFLDEEGGAWAQDTIEDPAATPFARDGDRMVARILLFQLAFERRFKGAFLELPGQRGEETAERLTLPFVPEASDDLARVWADPRTVVIEQRRTPSEPWQTLVASRTKLPALTTP